MTGFNETVEKEEARTFNKPVFLKLTQGTHVVRILQEDYKRYRQHYLGVPIECLGEDCPQCLQNKKILLDNNGNFDVAKKVKGFNWKQERGAVNVLDLTPVKVCPKCQTENYMNDAEVFSASCSNPECRESIMKVEPTRSNKVKLFSRAASVFDKLAVFHQTMLDKDGEPIGITNFNVELLVQGNTTIPHKTDDLEELDVPEDALYDLDQVVITITPEEMEKVMRGVSIRDVFAARRAVNEISTQEKEKSELTDEEQAELEKNINELF